MAFTKPESMRMRQGRLIMTALVTSMCCCLAADAGDGDNDRNKGIYEAMPLSTKDYRLVETSAELHAQFVRRGMLYGDAELDAWLQAIGDRLAAEPTDFYQEYRFYVLRDPSPNAFALPDGHIYVHSGMIARLGNEAQLASLLAHEINHVAGHHGILAFRSQKRKSTAAMFVGIVVGVAAANVGSMSNWSLLGGIMSDSGFIWSIVGYSLELEEEADREAYDRMLAANYDVREMPVLYEHLGKDFEGLEPRMNTKWSAYPDLVARAEHVRARIAETPPAVLDSLTLGSDDFRARTRPLVLASINDYIADDCARSALALARRLIDANAADVDAQVALGDAYFALGVRSEYAEPTEPPAGIPDARTNPDRNLAAAERAYHSAIDLDPLAAEAFRGIGNVRLQSGHYRAAAEAFIQYLNLRPDAPDRLIVMDHLHTIAAKLQSNPDADDDD